MAPVDDKFIRILVATDIHLGYGEKLPERSKDSFNSFDELLQIGKENQVDMAILGGDLFHENKPTRSAQINCVQILSKHVFGNDPIYLEYCSNPLVDFKHSNTKAVNYEDANLNISLPIFSIHGNHDDPSGLNQHSCMDVLHESKLLNYFGKVDNLVEIKLSPILLKKNGVKLAIYGLSNLKDIRLNKLFREKKVIFETPEDSSTWFNILVLHQNRAKRGINDYIPENFIPTFFNLVIWGHEHDCRIEPEYSTSGKDFFVSQPGSPVATSLTEGESIPKKVGILHIKFDNSFRMEPIPLQSVRPFVFVSKLLGEFKKINLNETDEKKLLADIEKELKFEVQEMIQQAQAQLTGHPKQGQLPLLRLRVEYSDEKHQLNPVRFGNDFIGQVANPGNLLHFKKRTVYVDRKIKDENTGLETIVTDFDEPAKRMEDYVEEFFQGDKKTNILSVRGLNGAMNRYINFSDGEAIGIIVEEMLKLKEKKIWENNPNLSEDELDDALADLKNNVEDEDDVAAATQRLDRPGRKRVPVPDTQVKQDDSDLEDEPVQPTVGQGRGRGGRGARRATATRGGAASRGAAASSRRGIVIEDSDEDEDYSVGATTGRQRASASPRQAVTATRGRARGRAAATSKAAATRGRTAAAAGQTSILTAFATQSQRTSGRSTQRSKKQMIESDSDEYE